MTHDDDGVTAESSSRALNTCPMHCGTPTCTAITVHATGDPSGLGEALRREIVPPSRRREDPARAVTSERGTACTSEAEAAVNVPAPSVPGRLRIGHLTYTVLLDNAVVDEECVRSQRNLSGYSSSGEQRIAVRADLPPDYRAEVVLHEVLHQCLRVSGVDPDQDAAAGLKDVEERAVNAIAGPLLAALRDNPALTAYLTHQEPQ